MAFLEAHIIRCMTDQRARSHSLEQRAGVVLGFSGVLIGLAYNTITSLPVIATIGAALAMIAATAAAIMASWALRPTSLKAITPERMLERLPRSPLIAARRKLLATLATEFSLAEKHIAIKGRWVTLSAYALAVAVAIPSLALAISLTVPLHTWLYALLFA